MWLHATALLEYLIPPRSPKLSCSGVGWMGRMGPAALERRLEAEHCFGGNCDPKLQHLLPGSLGVWGGGVYLFIYFLFNALLGGSFGSRWDTTATVGNCLLPAHRPIAPSRRRNGDMRCLHGSGTEYHRVWGILR